MTPTPTPTPAPTPPNYKDTAAALSLIGRIGKTLVKSHMPPLDKSATAIVLFSAGAHLMEGLPQLREQWVIANVMVRQYMEMRDRAGLPKPVLSSVELLVGMPKEQEN